MGYSKILFWHDGILNSNCFYIMGYPIYTIHICWNIPKSSHTMQFYVYYISQIVFQDQILDLLHILLAQLAKPGV